MMWQLSSLMILGTAALKTSHRSNYRSAEEWAFIYESQVATCSGQSADSCVQLEKCTWNEKTCMPLPQNRSESRCNNGGMPVPCFDLAECSKDQPGPTADARWAFVFTHTLERPLKHGIKDENLAPLQKLAKRLGNTDLILIVPKWKAIQHTAGHSATHNITDEVKDKLHQQGVKIQEVEWGTPPGMKYHPPPGKGWCGPQDLLRLHIFGMEQYAAVAYFDTDTQLTGNGDPTLPLRCAAQNYFIGTSGPASPYNIGYFAVKPSRALLDASVRYAQNVDFDPYTGWGGSGNSPMRTKFVGAECGQGFLHHMLYKQTEEADKAFKEAGATPPIAKQIDRCLWNYQKDQDCLKQTKEWTCDKNVIMVHKEDEWCMQKNMTALGM